MFLSWGCVSPDKLTLPWKDREGENTPGDTLPELRLPSAATPYIIETPLFPLEIAGLTGSYHPLLFSSMKEDQTTYCY